ncbi:hypothetical protein PanWU01x14_371040, partial [Parasponia andersonii]
CSMSRLQAHTYGSMSPKATTPASLPTSTDPPKQLPTAPTRPKTCIETWPNFLSPRSPPRNPHQLHLHFLTSCSDYEGNGLKSITRDPHSYVDI